MHILAYLGALAAALAYGSATVLQAIAVARMAALPKGTSLPRRAAAGWLYAAGLVLDGAGFLASAVALQKLPLFLVESTIAASVAVTAILAVVVLHQKLSRREITALWLLLAGLIVLGLTAAEGPSRAVPGWVGWALLGSVVLVALGSYLSWITLPQRASGISLAIIAGTAFGLVGVGARLLPEHPSLASWFTDPYAWSLLALGATSITVFGLALDRLETTTVAALNFAFETIVPSAIGISWLGDHVRRGLWPVALIGFALTLYSCMRLASKAEISL
ncbi:hypothetical protein [Corynebacterium heidelbergense]|uniref:hypothetical protein n=1 Tax=Corynebacterium heidelbergense TaxID=2055947 RepID=UPI001EE6CB7D|nr:hypothetical protein [Corynebacterium heidelbergense]WCZ35784.1 hypothetical protein CHEID_01030 [Corynebacterium heidelbergense]